MTAENHARALEVLGKITPGEWRIGRDKAAYLIPIREHSAGAHVVAWAEGCKDVRRPLQETEANACAIAAVPAFKALYAAVVEYMDAPDAESATAYQEMRDAAAAIPKAVLP